MDRLDENWLAANCMALIITIVVVVIFTVLSHVESLAFCSVFCKSVGLSVAQCIVPLHTLYAVVYSC